MNKALLREIIKHVYASLMIIPSSFINVDKSKSIIGNEYLLFKNKTEGEETLINNLWGCQISSNEGELKLLLADCSIDLAVKEYCLFVHLHNSPMYCMYLICDDELDEFDSEPLLACTIDNNTWLSCNTYLQATFLAGMEQIREINSKWTKCKKFEEEYKMIISFIRFHSATFYQGE